MIIYSHNSLLKDGISVLIYFKYFLFNLIEGGFGLKLVRPLTKKTARFQKTRAHGLYEAKAESGREEGRGR